MLKSRLCPAALALAAILNLTPAAAQEGEPEPLRQPACAAKSAILVDAATGSVLYQKSAHLRRPMASTTKVMTGSLILESGRLDDWISFSAHARATPYANLNLKPGEQIPMRDLLHAILLRSSNEGCVAAAEHLAGSEPAFVDLMNRKAAELGLANTHFVTTNGLYHKDHYSSAFDLAQLTRWAFRNPLFGQIVSTPRAAITRSVNTEDILIKNHNKLLESYPGADGVKTGYVRQSGRCLIASATRLENGHPWRLIAVVLNSTDTYGDVTALLDWGRTNFQPIFLARAGETVSLAPLHGADRPALELMAAADLAGIVPRGSGVRLEKVIRRNQLELPVRRGQVVGQLSAEAGGKQYASIDLIAAEDAGRAWYAAISPASGFPLLLVGFMALGGYAKAAKSYRRRRRRLAEIRRRIDRLREGHC